MLRTLAIASLLSLLACGDDKPGNPDVDAGDGQPDAAPDVDAPIAATPVVTSVDYPVITHGARLIISGTDLEGTTEVTIGGVVHTNLADVSAEAVTVMALDPTVAVGLAVSLTTTSPLGTSEPFELTVIHLVISEIDPDTPGADNDEFIELDIGLAEAVSLDGYVLGLFQGNSALGDTLAAIDLNAMTAASGLMVIGPNGIAPQVIFDGPNAIEQGEDAAAVYQFPGDVTTFPADFGTAGEAGLIDAVIWESGDDDVTADFGLMLGDDLVINEGDMAAARETVSVQRCLADATPRTGAAFGLLAPSPGMANGDCSVN